MSSPGLPAVPAAARVYPITVRWSDMDAYGHVNNVQYLRLFEEARTYGFKDWFGTERDLIEEGMLVVSQEVDYVVPLEHAYAPVRIALWCCDIAAASFELGYVVLGPEGDDVVYARGRGTLVAYDLGGRRPRRLGDVERTVLRSVHGDPPRLRGDRRAGRA